MPVATKPVQIGKQSLSKFREKPKMRRFVELLVIGLLFAIANDAAYFLSNCVQECPEPTYTVSTDIEETALEAPDSSAHMMKFYGSAERFQDIHQVSELGINAAKLNEDDGIPMQDCSNFPHNGGDDVEPTKKKNIMVYEDTACIEGIIHNIAQYKDQDVMDDLFSDIANNPKPLFDWAPFISSF